MSTALTYEIVQQDILAALRFVDDITGRTVPDAVQLQAPKLTLYPKRNGDLIVLDAQNFAAAGTDYPIDIRPLAIGYASRRVMLHLPRDPDPANAANANSLFQPALVPLLPSPDYRVGANLALLRVTLRRSTDQLRIGNALVQLTTTLPGNPGARALTDAAGEAILVLSGVPLTVPGPGAIVVADIAASLLLLVDPAIAVFTADADTAAARAASQSQTTGFPDPDDLAARFGPTAPAATAVTIGAGRVSFAKLAWSPA
jgi:hypothetical protein